MLYGLTDNEQIEYKRLSALSSSKLTEETSGTLAALEVKSHKAFTTAFEKLREEEQKKLSQLPTPDEEAVLKLLSECGPIDVPHSFSLDELQQMMVEVDRRSNRLVPLHNDLQRLCDIYESIVTACEHFITSSAPLVAEWKAKGFAGNLIGKEREKVARYESLLKAVKTVMGKLEKQDKMLSRIITVQQMEMNMHETPSYFGPQVNEQEEPEVDTDIDSLAAILGES